LAQSSSSTEEGSHGKLTKEKVRLSIVEAVLDRVIIYIIVWAIYGLILLWTKRKPIKNKLFLAVVFYLPQLQYNSFVLILIDVSFFSPRALMHSSNLTTLDLILVIVVLVLATVNLYFLIDLIFSANKWLSEYRFRRNIRMMEQEKQANAASSRDLIESMRFPVQMAKSPPEQRSVESPKIDLPRSLASIDAHPRVVYSLSSVPVCQWIDAHRDAHCGNRQGGVLHLLLHQVQVSQKYNMFIDGSLPKLLLQHCSSL
jgi:Sec-independent protein translocase protein TatA